MSPCARRPFGWLELIKKFTHDCLVSRHLAEAAASLYTGGADGVAHSTQPSPARSQVPPSAPDRPVHRGLLLRRVTTRDRGGRRLPWHA